MTCIVGLVHGGKVHIGGDSAGVAGLDLTVRSDAKVFENDGFVFGFTTSFRMGNLLQHALTPPRRHPDDDVHKFMVTDFINAVRACLKDGGFSKKENNVEEGGTFLVGYAGRLFYIDEDFQVGETASGYAACGCGNSIALGALYASEGMSPKKRVRQALKAAEQFSAGVRGPFNIVSTEVAP